MNLKRVTDLRDTEFLPMRIALYGGSLSEHREEIKRLFENRIPYFIFYKKGELLLELSLRPFADGCKSSPILYIEGIFIAEHLRGQGFGQKLVAFTKKYAAELGCSELASDAEISNVDSQSFHEKVGFEETGRVVLYRMAL